MSGREERKKRKGGKRSELKSIANKEERGIRLGKKEGGEKGVCIQALKEDHRNGICYQLARAIQCEKCGVGSC